MEQKQRKQIDQLLFQVLRTIFHYERSIALSYGLNFQQIYVLQHLRRHPNARLTEIAVEMELPKFTVSRLTNGLLDEGYISKKQDPLDRRNYHLNLEDKGEQVLLAIETASFTRISTNIQTLSPALVNELVEVAEWLPIVLGVTDQVKNQ
ncbi:MAG TPA: MarR family transcriptional regulator [Anaerolineaceae bacterium]|nr:MarR family transcriptional regulator [Anaerolineaceae bacterium]